MSIVPSEMQAYLSASVSDDDPSANGGPIAVAPMPLSSMNNAFPNVTSGERSRGDRKWRKIFLANANSDLDGVSPLVVMDKPTAYGDYAWFVPGGDANYESDLTGSEPMYGAAMVRSNFGPPSTEIMAQLEDSSLAAMFAPGREILISNRNSFENVTSTQGAEELHVITAVTPNGIMAVTLTLNRPLEHNFGEIEGARISVVYRPPVIRPGKENAVPIWVCAVVPPDTTEYGLTDIPIGWQVESLK